MILLAKDNRGYRNLMRIVSDAATDGFYYKPRVTLEALREYHDGILATSACIAGVIPKSIDRGEFEVAKEWAQTFIDIFGKDDFYIELQNRAGDRDRQRHQPTAPQRRAVQARERDGPQGRRYERPDYLRQEDAYTQDLMLCIGMGKFVSDTKRMKFSNDQFYLKSRKRWPKRSRSIRSAWPRRSRLQTNVM